MNKLQILLTGLTGFVSVGAVSWVNIAQIVQILIQITIGIFTVYSLIKSVKKRIKK